MAKFSVSNTRISALCSCVPKHIEYTTGYAHISTDEQTLFTKTTGIRERRVAPEGVTCSDLCYAAALDIFRHHDCRNEIDAVVFVSQSPDYYLPATAVLLQHRLGLKKDCLAFDVNLGCSGYVYGLSIVGNLLQAGQLKKALLLVGDKSTISTNYADKSTYPLFGDAGTATLLTYDETASPWYFNLQSDGAGKDAIIIEDGGCRHPYSAASEIITEIEPGIARKRKDLALDGMEIFNFALREVAANIHELLAYSHTEKGAVNYFVLHQANRLINETVRKKLKIEPQLVPYSIDVFGNTSSASIPLTMCHALPYELREKQQTLLLSGFGVGYSWGSAILKTGPMYINLVEYD